MSGQAKTLKKLSNKEYRDSYLPARVRSTIALQVRQFRKGLGLTQKQFAKRIGKSQSDVSHIEDPDGDHVTVQTLLDIACALDIALVVRFASYPKFLQLMSDMTPEGLSASPISQSMTEIELFGVSMVGQTKYLGTATTGIPLTPVGVEGTATWNPIKQLQLSPHSSGVLVRNTIKQSTPTYATDGSVFSTLH